MTTGANQLEDARAAVHRLLSPRLEDLGFIRHGTAFAVELRPRILGIFGFGISAVDPIEISPTVGVCFEEIEELISRLYGIEPELGAYTIFSPLRYVGPRASARLARTRIFGDDVDMEVATRLIDDVRLHGLPFMREWSHLSKLIDYMKGLHSRNEPGMVPDTSARLPIALFTIGQVQEGLAIVRRTVTTLGSIRNKGYVFWYRRFAAEYERLAEAKGSR